MFSTYKSYIKEIKQHCADMDSSSKFGNVYYDMQITESQDIFSHIPNISGPVRFYNKKKPLPYEVQETNSRGQSRLLVYKSPVSKSKISFCHHKVERPPCLEKRLRDGPSRNYQIYMERHYLVYSRAVTSLETSLKKLVTCVNHATWSSERPSPGKGTADALFCALRDYDFTDGYLQSTPNSWKRRSGKWNRDSNRLLISIYKAIRICKNGYAA